MRKFLLIGFSTLMLPMQFAHAYAMLDNTGADDMSTSMLGGLSGNDTSTNDGYFSQGIGSSKDSLDPLSTSEGTSSDDLYGMGGISQEEDSTNKNNEDDSTAFYDPSKMNDVEDKE